MEYKPGLRLTSRKPLFFGPVNLDDPTILDCYLDVAKLNLPDRLQDTRHHRFFLRGKVGGFSGIGVI